MHGYRFTTAIGTPLNDDSSLHREGLAAQLDDQHRAGFDSILAGGTMGTMQALPDETWRQLASACAESASGRFELLVGAGDCSLPRTLERIAYLNGLQGVDGVVVLAPYLFTPAQAELADYYRALADASNTPLYLYDLPQLTKVAMTLDTVTELSRHPNIAGIKCSGPWNDSRKVLDTLGDSFRVIVAQPEQLDVLLRHGVHNHLDGMFAAAPDWTMAIGKAATAGDWETAARWQRRLTALRDAFVAAGVWPAFTAVMNARGIPGRFMPPPIRMFGPAEREALLSNEVVAELLRTG
jgi:4-hydroxy-tetrahydrodipicolinate synthase